jgi:hypothetical protein
MAVSMASVPLFVKKNRAGFSPGKRGARVSAISITGMVGKRVDTCWRTLACFSRAATTRGSQWPSDTVTIPPKKSRYFLPSES